MLLNIHPDSPEERKIRLAVECLKSGGVIIYPTDAVYSIGCDIYNSQAVERIARLKGIDPSKANFSLVCENLSALASFCKQVPTPVYKLMKRALPGPYTFIVEASNQVPKIFKSKKKTVGIRVPDNSIASKIVEMLGNPIMATSVYGQDGEPEYITDPELIYERYKDKVDMVINGGLGNLDPSTVIDCTGDQPLVVREGRGPIDGLL
jgi:tRNA threonylcarbamoyl adenosine modification protein (Sua5/YciO/YrdC/YwlC family)